MVVTKVSPHPKVLATQMGLVERTIAICSLKKFYGKFCLKIEIFRKPFLNGNHDILGNKSKEHEAQKLVNIKLVENPVENSEYLVCWSGLIFLSLLPSKILKTRNFWVIFASSISYFTEKSCWVPLI